MDTHARDAFDRLAAGEAVDPAALDSELRPLVETAALLAAAGRTVEPPSGSFERVIGRASQPRPVAGSRWLRPALTLVGSAAVLLTALGGGAYASTPGQPLFGVQRALDRMFVDLPRPADEEVRASLSVADRRVKQAVTVAGSASPDLLRLTLADALEYLDRARAAAARVSDDGRRRDLAATLARAQRDARAHLDDAKGHAHGESDDVLAEASSELERDEEHDRRGAEPRKTAEPRETTEPAESPEPRGTAEPRRTAEPSDSPEPAESPQPRESAEPAESPQPRESAEPQKTAEPAESPEPQKTAEPLGTSDAQHTARPTPVGTDDPD